MKSCLAALLLLTAGCEQSKALSNITSTAPKTSQYAGDPLESEASRQSRAAREAAKYMPKSYEMYPAYLRFWAEQADSNDVLCFGGNGSTEDTRKNCDERDLMIELIKTSGWCRRGAVGQATPSWYLCGRENPKALQISDQPREDDQDPSAADNGAAPLDENGKQPIWNAQKPGWEEEN